MDTVTERSAVVVAVDALVRDKAAPLDIDSLELYEWALSESGFAYEFSQTIGVLRARWAKANPSSPAVMDCLEACVRAWDLVNAQQVRSSYSSSYLIVGPGEAFRLTDVDIDRCHIRQGPARQERRQEHVLEHHPHSSALSQSSFSEVICLPAY